MLFLSASLRAQRSNLTKPAPLAPVILGTGPSILWHQGRSHPSPREGEGAGLPAGEGDLKNRQKAFNPHLQHLCNNKANLLTRLEPCCQKILGTGPRMTCARDASLVSGIILVLNALLPKVSFFLPNPAKTC